MRFCINSHNLIHQFYFSKLHCMRRPIHSLIDTANLNSSRFTLNSFLFRASLKSSYADPLFTQARESAWNFGPYANLCSMWEILLRFNSYWISVGAIPFIHANGLMLFVNRAQLPIIKIFEGIRLIICIFQRICSKDGNHSPFPLHNKSASVENCNIYSALAMPTEARSRVLRPIWNHPIVGFLT